MCIRAENGSVMAETVILIFIGMGAVAYLAVRFLTGGHSKNCCAQCPASLHGDSGDDESEEDEAGVQKS